MTWSYDDQVAQVLAPGRFAFNLEKVEKAGNVKIVAKSQSGYSIETSTNIVIIEPAPTPPKFTVELPR